MNKVELIGRLTRDTETRGEGDKTVGRYTLAVERRFAKADADQKADFINIVAFGKAGEFAGKYFKKGMRVAVIGRIQTGSFTNKDGQKVYTFDIVAEEQEFCESKNNGSSEGEAVATASESSDNDFMSIPDSAKEDFPF